MCGRLWRISLLSYLFCAFIYPSMSLSGYLHSLASLILRESLAEVVVLGRGVLDAVMPSLKSYRSSQAVYHNLNQTLRPCLVATAFPPHSASQPVMPDVVGFLACHVWCVVADHLSCLRIEAVRGTAGSIVVHMRALEWKVLVIKDTILPVTFTNTIVRASRTLGALKGSAVKWHAEDNLGWVNTALEVKVNSGGRRKRRATRVLSAGKQVGLVASHRVPTSSIVVTH